MGGVGWKGGKREGHDDDDDDGTVSPHTVPMAASAAPTASGPRDSAIPAISLTTGTTTAGPDAELKVDAVQSDIASSSSEPGSRRQSRPSLLSPPPHPPLPQSGSRHHDQKPRLDSDTQQRAESSAKANTTPAPVRSRVRTFRTSRRQRYHIRQQNRPIPGDQHAALKGQAQPGTFLREGAEGPPRNRPRNSHESAVTAMDKVAAACRRSAAALDDLTRRTFRR